MAILTATVLSEIRKGIENDVADLGISKATLNAVVQSLEDWYENNKATLSSGMNTITSPITLTNATKKKIFAYWLFSKFGREVI